MNAVNQKLMEFPQAVFRTVPLMVLCCFLSAASSARAEGDASRPARIVTEYALTSTHDLAIYDPADWTLLGSTNSGKTWVTLDVEKNQTFGSRNQCRVFPVTNEIAFDTYRLQIDKVNSANAARPELASVQLAEVELRGPATGVANESELGTLITSSRAHPLMGPPENAFDNDLTTHWADFGIGEPDGCWLQCQYVPLAESQALITSIGDLRIRARLAATRDLFLERGPQILSNLAARIKPPAITGYALTSANDATDRDPSQWRLLGSNNGGKTWEILDARSDEIFSTRFQRRVFNLATPASYAAYRLEIVNVSGGSGSLVQLGELEPLYVSKGDADQFSLVVSAETDNPPAESTDMAFDGDAKTKWLSFTPPAPGKPNWIQWQYLPKEEGLPVINLRRLDRLANNTENKAPIDYEAKKQTRALTGYALTSANDAPERDPRDWRLLGSRDNGKTWDTLDARSKESFAKRLQKRTFTLAKTAAYPLYRLEIDSVASPDDANSVQLAGLEPLYASKDAGTKYSILVSAAGENAPTESVGNLFDALPQSKWLDYANGNKSRASWIQWQYATGLDQGVIDVSHLETAAAAPARAWAPRPIFARIEGAVVSWDRETKVIGLLDETGFQELQLDVSITNARPGQRAQLTGQLRFEKDPPAVVHPRLAILGGLPVAADVDAGQRPTEGQHFLYGAAEGKAVAVSQDRYFTTIRLAGKNSDGQLRVKILNSQNSPLPSFAERQIRAQGVVEPVLDEQGRRVAGVIWAASPADLSLAAPTEAEWNAWPQYSFDNLPETNFHSLSLARVRGTVVDSHPGESVTLSDGTTRAIAYSKQMGSFPAGSAVEAAGFLAWDGDTLTFRSAYARAAAAEKSSVASAGTPELQPVDEEHPATQIRQVRELLKNEPDRQFPFKVRGVITYIDLGLSTFYLQDGPDAISIAGELKAGLYPMLGQEGTRVELRGIARDGSLHCTGFVDVLGKGRMPAPLRHSWDYLMTGRDDGLWVEVEGVVSAFEKQRLTLTLAGGQLIVWINEMDRNIQDRVLGSVVRVNGVCEPVVNSRGQRLGLRLLVPSSEYVEVVTASITNPFDLPIIPIGSIMKSGSDDSSKDTELVRTKGTVIYKGPSMLFIQDKRDGLRVLPREDAGVATGDLVEIVGLPRPDGFSPKLVQALVRKAGHVPLPEARPIDLLGLNQNSQDSSQDATRGQVEAVFLGRSSANESVQALEFQDVTRKNFLAFLPVGGRTPLLPPVGSRVRLEGVFKAKTDTVPDFGEVVTSFEVYLNSPADIAVLERPPWWTARHTFWVLAGVGVVLFLALSWASSLRKQVRQRTRELREEIEERKRTGAMLEAEIAERKKMETRVEKTHKELLSASRQAGMAEVATSVLHNVGNVLNSVNISSAIVAEKIRNSKVANLSKAVSLLQANAGNLAEFLDKDPKGKQLPSYLGNLADHLSTERDGLLEELTSLSDNVEHIKEIVAMQQNYACVSGVIETLPVADLVEDALRMNVAALERHRVEIVREYASVPSIMVDKHKVLQILVNLLRNAKYACDESNSPAKKITLRITGGEDRVRIAVIDNGIGISKENFTRIFSHGFTTKKDGHGFGLHSGALAAKEMGGALLVHSDGVGCGAAFTLELPLAAAADGTPPKAKKQTAELAAK